MMLALVVAVASLLPCGGGGCGGGDGNTPLLPCGCGGGVGG